MSDKRIKFITESNAIEGIHRSPTDGEIAAHEKLWALDYINVADIEAFVISILVWSPTKPTPLRMRKGMDVRVGSHIPIPGGDEVVLRLESILGQIAAFDPYQTHCDYETLHPFMDGNGRSGRALWAWHMIQDGRDPFSLPFLHRWYYDSLSHSR